jgi:hypothetical protein
VHDLASGLWSQGVARLCPAGFEDRPWYQQLYEFSAPQNGTSRADEDADVVPVLVRNVVAPLVLHMAERVRLPAAVMQGTGSGAVKQPIKICMDLQAHSPVVLI